MMVTQGNVRDQDPSPGDLSPELVPVVEPGALGLLPQPAETSAGELALGDLLSDALFGEVIDISDLIPRVLSPSAEAAASSSPANDVAGTADLGLADSVHLLVAAGHASALTILYDDDILVSDGTNL